VPVLAVVRLGIEAPIHVPVHRHEVYEAIQRNLRSDADTSEIKPHIIPPDPEPKPRIFLCHAKEDDARIAEFYYRLRDRGWTVV